MCFQCYSEAIEAANISMSAGWGVMVGSLFALDHVSQVSHRSGETEDLDSKPLFGAEAFCSMRKQAIFHDSRAAKASFRARF